MRVGILGSTRGTNMLALIQAIAEKRLAAQIAVVISNKAEAGILQRAKAQHLPAYFVDAAGLSREAYDQKISVLLQQYQVDLIVLIGYMRILSTDFVKRWQNKIINVHPALLPAFAGKMDLEVHRAVLAAGVLQTGCTVHYVTEVVDAGEIIVQKQCAVLPSDTAESLKARVQQLEGEALIEAIQKL